MGLEDLYKNASADSYVGMARDRQSSTAPVDNQLVNYMDGTARTHPNTAADEFQTEFTRNAPGSFKTGGAQGPATTNDTSYPLSRWTERALTLAFEATGGTGPASLRHGFYIDRFRKDSAGNLTHHYTPLVGAKFVDVNPSAKSRASASPSGAPGGPGSL